MEQDRIEEKSRLYNWLSRLGGRFNRAFVLTDPSTPNDSIVFANRSFTSMTGYSLEEVQGQNLQVIFGELTDCLVIEEFYEQLRNAEPVHKEMLNYKKDGTAFWNELMMQPLVNGSGKVLYHAIFMHDATDLKKDEVLLLLQKKIFLGINEGIGINDLMDQICEIIKGTLPKGVACSMLVKDSHGQWTMKEEASIPLEIMRDMEKSVVHKEKEIKKREVLVEQYEPNVGVDFRASWSLPIVDNDNGLSCILVIFMKGTETPTKAQLTFIEKILPIIQMAKKFYDQQEQYRQITYMDVETGLPNRQALLQQLKTYIKQNKKHFIAAIEPSEYSKIINLYGRNAADELFIQLARRIRKFGKEVYVGRLSSASLIVIKEIEGDKEGEFYIVQLKRVISEPFIIAGEEIFLTVKVGISIANKETIDAEEILRRADIAVTDAKNRSGNSISFYGNLKNEKVAKEMKVFIELTKALTVNELDVYLQPKVNLKTTEIIGFEALARWNSEVLGHVPPNVFIPVAESTGKIIKLEINILTKVMEWHRIRQRSGKKMYQVAVNISVAHFFNRPFVNLLKELVKEYGVEAKYIRLELTESIGLVNFTKAKNIFNRLHRAGFDVSVDDFGVGYSSLSYLPQLQVDELKIDRSFIHELSQLNTHAVVTTIIQLANNLNMSTVAEGIEEEWQIEELISLGCKIGQGFYYYKPMPLHEIDLLLQ